MDGYTITQLDPINNLIYASFTYNGNSLDGRFPATNIQDPNAITQDVENAYNSFQQTIDSLPQAAPLPLEVTSLVGQAVDAGTFNAQVASLENETLTPSTPSPISQGT